MPPVPAGEPVHGRSSAGSVVRPSRPSGHSGGAGAAPSYTDLSVALTEALEQQTADGRDPQGHFQLRPTSSRIRRDRGKRGPSATGERQRTASQGERRRQPGLGCAARACGGWGCIAWRWHSTPVTPRHGGDPPRRRLRAAAAEFRRACGVLAAASDDAQRAVTERAGHPPSRRRGAVMFSETRSSAKPSRPGADLIGKRGRCPGAGRAIDDVMMCSHRQTAHADRVAASSPSHQSQPEPGAGCDRDVAQQRLCAASHVVIECSRYCFRTRSTSAA